MTAPRIASVSTPAEDLAACQAVTLEIARELGRRAAREDFQRPDCKHQAPLPVSGRTSVRGDDVQDCFAAHRN